MDLVEVDVVGLEALEAGVDGVQNVSAGGADVVAPRTGAAEDLGSDDDVFSGDIQVLQGLAQGLFALALGVDISGVEEVDTGVDGGLDELVGSGLVDYGAEAGAGAAVGAGALSVSLNSNTIRGEPTATLSPGEPDTETTRPLTGAGTSTAALSVITSTMS